jgi:hypothetical protein
MIEINFDKIIRETQDAWLLDTGDEKVWFPKSQCTLDEDEKIIEVPEWLAIEKGLV